MKNPESQFLEIQYEIQQVSGEVLTIQLPAWRPGRYEVANFAKNIRGFRVTNGSGEQLSYSKSSKDRWEIITNGAETVFVDYEYYAAELNAGSTWLDSSQMYVNPVNCCFYVPARLQEACELVVKVPYPFEIACGLKKKEGAVFHAESFHELADSPFIASPYLQHEEYEIAGTKFHIWFQGEIKPNWAKIQLDFERFTEKQIEAFGDFPVEEYHFLFQITPYATYHGVEHTTSTVCALGPGYDIMGKKYVDFLGVSSHELYHAWNVKTIRPKAMLPYNYARENYSELGYVYEGVTTYMGDKFLFSSGVFSEEQYFKELAAYVERHFHNGGRFNLSVAESSLDTWLDGYVQGIPNRKTSIYVEGCLFSLIIDVQLRTLSGKGLDDVMKSLYQSAKKGRGYTAEDYQQLVVNLAKKDLSYLFEKLLFTSVSYEPELKEALDLLGLTLNVKQDTGWARRLGLKGKYFNGAYQVLDVAQKSDADKAKIIRQDRIVSVNSFEVNDDLDKWLEYFGKEEIELGLLRNGKLGFIRLIPEYDKGFMKYTIARNPNATDEQKRNFEIWKN